MIENIQVNLQKMDGRQRDIRVCHGNLCLIAGP